MVYSQNDTRHITYIYINTRVENARLSWRREDDGDMPSRTASETWLCVREDGTCDRNFFSKVPRCRTTRQMWFITIIIHQLNKSITINIQCALLNNNVSSVNIERALKSLRVSSPFSRLWTFHHHTIRRAVSKPFHARRDISVWIFQTDLTQESAENKIQRDNYKCMYVCGKRN